MVSVLVVDDSAVSRQLLRYIFASDPEVRVVGEATDGQQALGLAKRLKPDVITMDVNMPSMDGIEATSRIMQEIATPVVIITGSFSPDHMAVSAKAIRAGALTVLEKPRGAGSRDFERQAAELLRTVKLMAEVKVVTRHASPTNARPAQIPRRMQHSVEVVGIAASTGGPVALATVLGALPATLDAPILVVQHISSGFDEGLRDWLNTVSSLSVRFPQRGERLQAGQVLLAPYDVHLGVTLDGKVSMSSAPPIKGHRPSATHLFHSLALGYGVRALGVVLTGMGDDGAEGLVALRQAGGTVIAQDEASSVVYGMPRRAVELGGVSHILAVDQIAAAISAAVGGVAEPST